MKTDTQLQKDVMEELRWDPRLDAAEIGVAVTKGIVTLSGEVNSYAKKIAAEKAVWRIREVKGLAEEIIVNLPFDSRHTDADIAESAVKTLRWNTTIPDHKVTVKVEDGWITIEGEVYWEYQKDEIQRTLQNIAGVRGLTNWVIVQPRAKTPLVKDAIKRALERRADIEAKRIEVETKGDEVTLRGKVRTWTERNEVEQAVWNSPGVLHVKNKLVLG